MSPIRIGPNTFITTARYYHSPTSTELSSAFAAGSDGVTAYVPNINYVLFLYSYNN